MTPCRACGEACGRRGRLPPKTPSTGCRRELEWSPCLLCFAPKCAAASVHSSCRGRRTRTAS
eukprot:1450004-Lingulodinium_polyedra.AAC.1